jgi:hypothetical protein
MEAMREEIQMLQLCSAALVQQNELEQRLAEVQKTLVEHRRKAIAGRFAKQWIEDNFSDRQ